MWSVDSWRSVKTIIQHTGICFPWTRPRGKPPVAKSTESGHLTGELSLSRDRGFRYQSQSGSIYNHSSPTQLNTNCFCAFVPNCYVRWPSGFDVMMQKPEEYMWAHLVMARFLLLVRGRVHGGRVPNSWGSPRRFQARWITEPLLRVLGLPRVLLRMDTSWRRPGGRRTSPNQRGGAQVSISFLRSPARAHDLRWRS